MKELIARSSKLDYNKNDIFWRDFVHLEGNPYVSNLDMHGFKCLLVYLTTKDDLSKYNYPISLGYAASILRMNNADVKILIQDAEDYDRGLFSRYDLICFYPMVFLLNQILEYTEKVKRDFPETKTCYFNSDQHQHEMLLCIPGALDFATNLMRHSSFIDYILIGEAEKSLLCLCEKLIKADYDFTDVPSCLYREKDEIKFSTRPSEPVNFDCLPFASRDYLDKAIRIQSSRGCVSSCLFCVESATNLSTVAKRKTWSGRDINKLVDEIEMLSRNFNTVFFNIIDSSFEDPGIKGIKRMKRFLREILSRNIQISSKIHLKAETIGKLDDNDLHEMKDAGVDILGIGIESGIERELKSYKKSTTRAEWLEGINRLDKFGKFFIAMGHMMFSASLRLEEVYEKARYLESIHRGWNYLNMSNNVLAFRGTAYHNYLKKMGLALETSPISGVIPYRYEDERVGYVAQEMGALKKKCPEVVYLNHLLYDGHNIISRYYNRMNKHLWEKEKYFTRFKEDLKELLIDIERVLLGYLTEVIDLASIRWSQEKADLIYAKWIPDYFPGTFDRTGQLINDFIEGFKKMGLSTEKIYLKTWLSLINVKANTSKGRVSNAEARC